MPTSTTVSIVFELLGAAVIMALIKISGTAGESFSALSNYINTDKAAQIILWILLSVVIAFTIGRLYNGFLGSFYISLPQEKIKNFALFEESH